MSFADPQKVKIGAKEYTLPRTSVGEGKSIYTYEDGTVVLSAATAIKNRKRQTVRLDENKITPDPYSTTQNVEVSMSAYLVIDRPIAGYTNAEALEAVKGFIESLTASENLLIKKLLAGES